MPAFSSALAYFDALRTGAKLWTNLVQAQRDYFGAHTYQRTDKPGTFHTNWQALEEEVESVPVWSRTAGIICFYENREVISLRS